MNTRQTISLTATLLSITLSLAGCGSSKVPQGKFTPQQMSTIPLTNRYNLPEATGGMIFSVDSETISANEIIAPLQESLTPLAQRLDEESFVSQTRPVLRQMVRDKAADLLLYKEAKKNAPEDIDDKLDQAVEKEVKRLVARYGNDYAEAEKQLKAAGMDWRSYRDFQRKMILTQSYLSSNLAKEKTFSHTDLLNYYNEVKDAQFHQDGTLEFRLIDLQPDKLPADQVAPGEDRSQAARRIARELVTKLQNGDDFAALAAEYSQGPLASRGGLWRPVTLGTDSLPQPYDRIEAEAKNAQPGQLIGPVETDGHLLIIRVEDIRQEQTKPFEAVQQILETQLQMQYQKEMQAEMLDKLIKRADLLELERFSEFCAREAYRRWSGR